jgi:hypothetical protein
MAHLYVGLTTGIARIDTTGGRPEQVFSEGRIHRLECDPLRPERIFASMEEGGLWRTDDGGETWRKVGAGITKPSVTIAAVSRAERVGGYGVVYVGTEPSAIFRSEDGGESFHELEKFQDIPSRADWSFPGRPHLHHVVSLVADPDQEGIVMAGIELGGIMRTTDGGETWEDTVPNAESDPHTMLTHPTEPGRVYIAGGGSYAESFDHGATWTRPDKGLEPTPYLFSMGIDPGDPDTMIVVAANDPFSGHGLPGFPIRSTQCRRSGGGAFEEVLDGLPDPVENPMGWMAANNFEPGAFYYTTIDGRLFSSADKGASFDPLSVEWDAAEVYTTALLAVPA